MGMHLKFMGIRFTFQRKYHVDNAIIRSALDVALYFKGIHVDHVKFLSDVTDLCQDKMFRLISQT